MTRWFRVTIGDAFDWHSGGYCDDFIIRCNGRRGKKWAIKEANRIFRERYGYEDDEEIVCLYAAETRQQ